MASAPVPDVVGRATKGKGAAVSGRPRPTTFQMIHGTRRGPASAPPPPCPDRAPPHHQGPRPTTHLRPRRRRCAASSIASVGSPGQAKDNTAAPSAARPSISHAPGQPRRHAPHAARVKPGDQGRRPGGLAPAEPDALRPLNAKGHHTVIVAATARPHRAYFASRRSRRHRRLEPAVERPAAREFGRPGAAPAHPRKPRRAERRGLA